MRFSYHSFLICQHSDHADVYVNGLQLGQIKDDRFYIHQTVLPDGTKKPFHIKQAPDGSFENLNELINAVQRILCIMDLKDGF